MGHHDHWDRRVYDGKHLHHFKKLAKKVGLCGCGCISLLTVFFALAVFTRLSGIKDWIMPAVAGLASRLPESIPLPDGFRIPALSGLLKLSPQEQIQLGREVARQEGVDQNAFSGPAIDSVAERLVAALPSRYRGPQGSGWEWRFQGVRTREGLVNAMALPGGKIYLYDGLLKLTDNDPNLLAMVVGHEMAHVVEEHSAEQLRSSGVLRTVTELIGFRTEEGQGPLAEAMRVLATRLGKQIVSMQLSQSAEFQADALGVQFMKDADFDSVQGIRILERMHQLTQSQGRGNPVLGRIFSTHPPIPDRLKRLRDAGAL